MAKKNDINNKVELEIGNMVKIILIIVMVFGMFYILTYYIQQKQNNNNSNYNSNDDDLVTIIQYDEILIGSILAQSEDSYYVLITNQKDYENRYNEYISRYNNNNKFYYSIIDNGLNGKYKSETSNLNIENIQDLKISGTTLLKIIDGKIVEYYDGDSEVMQAIIKINKV